MKIPQSIVVIDPVSSARRYGTEITKKGFRSVALVTREQIPWNARQIAQLRWV